ncbi:MAG TPA: DUF3999 family protein [Candidatus Acidoferrales bacterium]|nr:DUF3999 family protein [Candidatus Acidoferrales bacterium]
MNTGARSVMPSAKETARGAIAALLSAAIVLVILAPRIAAQNASSLPGAWTHWKYFRAIHLDDTPTERLVSVVVPQEVYARSANRLADLRVTDDRGAEAPYLLEARYGNQQTVELNCRLMESSFVPQKYSQVICDAGEGAGFHNGIRIQTPEQNFMAWAEVAVSDDARQWRIVDERSPIYEFPERNLGGENTLHYGDTNARYVRLRVFLSVHKFPVSSIAVLHNASKEKESVLVRATFTPSTLKISGQIVWEANLGATLVPVDEVRIETTQPEFSRRASVDASNDGENWYECGSGDVYRFRQGTTQKESLRMHFYEQWAPHLRVHIVNGSDPPLEALRVTLYMTPRRIVFRQEPGGKYSLLYGQSEAKAPVYDISQTLSAEQARAALPVSSVGPEEINSAWSDPRPWTDRHESVLWIAAILAALLLGVVALRSLSSASPPAA